MHINYLGLQIIRNGKSGKEGKTESYKTVRVVGCLINIELRNNYMLNGSKVMIYKSYKDIPT